MTIPELHELLETTGFPVWKYRAVQEDIFKEEMPFIVYHDTDSYFDVTSGTIWRKITNVGIDVFSQKDGDAEMLEKVLLKNNIIPKIIRPIWIEDEKIINTQFDIVISQSFCKDDLS